MKLVQDFGVRALIGTIVITPAIFALVWLSLTGSGEALATLGTIASMVIGYYFGQRQPTQ